MKIISIYEAKANLPKLIEQALNGKDVIIGEAGKPLVRLIPHRTEQIVRQPGCWRGKVKIVKDFDQLPAGIQDAFTFKSKKE